MIARKLYYMAKPCIPRTLQLAMRRRLMQWKQQSYTHCWPIDPAAGTPPAGWGGWPEQKRFALILTHDVESASGHDKCDRLMALEEQLGFRSSFNFVPERYDVSPALRTDLMQRGFEVGVHGLHHDGKLYSSHAVFQERAAKINRYIADWQAVGFRSPAMHHNLDWIHALDIRYDASTFDTAPFESQPDGMGTIFPFWVTSPDEQNGYVELPYTLPQDFYLFVLMCEPNIDIWKRKLDWIVEHGGMVLMNTHPDYMSFGDGALGLEEYPADFYAHFLQHITAHYRDQYWHVLPKEMAQFWTTTMHRAP